MTTNSEHLCHTCMCMIQNCTSTKSPITLTSKNTYTVDAQTRIMKNLVMQGCRYPLVFKQKWQFTRAQMHNHEILCISVTRDLFFDIRSARVVKLLLMGS